MKKGFLFLGTLLITAFTVGAATGIKITASLQNQSISYNGSLSAQQVVSYNGTTYVPLRSFSTLLNVPVEYKNGIIYLGGGNDATTKTNEPQQTKASYGLNNPAPVGTGQGIIVKGYTQDYTAEIVVRETIRGTKALEMLKKENPYNRDPASDEEYILAKINVKAVNVAEDKSLSVRGYDFELYSSENSKYDRASVVTPEPELDSTLYTGASAEGWTVFKVKKSDVNPKIVYGVNYDGTGGIWFSLK